MFVPSAAQAKAAAIRRCGRSQALPYANELPQLLPGVRGLTTPFRSDGQTTLPCLQCRLLAPLQSVVRSLATSPPQCFVVINSHTRRSRSPVTHPKTPVDSTPRPIPAAAPRKRAPTLHYKSHPSYSSHHWFLPTKPPLSRFLQGLGFYLASPKLCGQAAEQGGCPRSCGRPLCSATSPPSAARRPAIPFFCPGQEVFASLLKKAR